MLIIFILAALALLAVLAILFVLPVMVVMAVVRARRRRTGDAQGQMSDPDSVFVELVSREYPREASLLHGNQAKDR